MDKKNSSKKSNIIYIITVSWIERIMREIEYKLYSNRIVDKKNNNEKSSINYIVTVSWIEKIIARNRV